MRTWKILNNNNNRAYTPLSERCSQSRVFISQYNINHVDNTVSMSNAWYELSSMISATLRRVNISTTYQIQISKKIHADIAIPTDLQMYTIK